MKKTWKMKQGFKENLVLITFLICCFHIKSSESQPAFTAGSAYTSGYLGESLELTCNGLNMNTDDVVWSYTVPPSSTPTPIYIDNVLTLSADKYSVYSFEHIRDNITTRLTIKNLQPADGTYIYKCECNRYKKTCAAVQTSAQINVTAMGKI